MSDQKKPAIVLLSGGMDSATVLAVAQAEGFTPIALSFRYGQRHVVELDAARRVAEAAGVGEHLVVEIDLRVFGGSALTADIPVPHERDLAATDIPITYVPARNTIFLSYALALAEVRGSRDIYLGVNHIDYSGYPDCRPEYIAAFERLAGLATKAGVEGHPVRLHTPLIALTKVEIVRLGLSLGVDFGLTRSCYAPDGQGRSCGTCDSCRLRLAAFVAIGKQDPIPYA